MCYLLRQQPTEASLGPATLPPSGSGHRPRWAGAIAAAVIGSVALAALFAPAPTGSADDAKASASAGPVIDRGALVPAATTTRQGLAPDDGVPTLTDTAKSGAGNCSHGL